MSRAVTAACLPPRPFAAATVRHHEPASCVSSGACRYSIETLAVLKLANPCYCAASIAPRPIAPNPKDAQKDSGPEAPGDPAAVHRWRVHMPMPLLVMAVGGKVVLVEVVADPNALELSEQALEAAAEVQKQTSAPEALMRQVFAQLLERSMGRGGPRGDTGDAAASPPVDDAAPTGMEGSNGTAAERAQAAAGEGRDGSGDEDGSRDGGAGEAGGGAAGGCESSGADLLSVPWTQRVMVRPPHLPLEPHLCPRRLRASRDQGACR